jgi:hypothetical protein
MEGVNDLDKRIAELKGYVKFHDTEAMVKEDPKSLITKETACWSTSDAKALELVDELDFPFKLLTLSETPAARWLAHFHYPETQKYPNGEIGSTRPEAICKAYIAAREWMDRKAGA